jgi:hypothetical protein
MADDTPSPVPPAPKKLPTALTFEIPTAARRSRSRSAKLTYSISKRVAVWTLVWGVVCGPLLYAWYHFQHERHIPAHLDRARALFAKEAWNDAAGAINRYLQIRPNDPEALVLRAQLSDKLVMQQPALKKLVMPYYESAIRANPNRRDLLLQRAQALFDAKRYAEALEQVTKLRQAPGDKPAQQPASLAAHEADVLAVDRLYAAAYCEAGRKGRRYTLLQIIHVFEDALRMHPGDVVLSTGLANLLDEYAAELPSADRAATIAEADSVLNEMVSRHPGDRQALLARYRFQNSHVDPKKGRDQLPEQRQDTRQQDLDELLQTASDDPEVLLRATSDYAERAIAAAEQLTTTSNAAEFRRLRATAKEQTAIAMGHAQKFLEVAPPEQKDYLTVAVLMSRMNQLEKAIETLKVGLLRFGEDDLKLNHRLLLFYLRAGDSQAARATLERIGPVFARVAPTLAPHHRRRVDEDLDMAEARIQILEGNAEAALPKLKRLTVTVTERIDPQSTLDERVRRWRILAAAYSQLDMHKESGEAYDTLVRLAPRSAEHHLKSALEWYSDGDTARAFQRLDGAPNAPGAWMSFAKTRLDLQLGKTDANERVWQDFDEVVKQARSRFPNDAALVVLEAAAALTRDDRQRALDLLQSLGAKVKIDWPVLPRLAAVWHLAGNSAAANTALDQFREAGGDPVEFALTESDLLSQLGEKTVAIAVLEQALDQNPAGGQQDGNGTDSDAVQSARQRLQELRKP